jgi:hypothetical protein
MMDKENVMHTHTKMDTHTVEYYSSIKKNEIILFAGKWVELEIIILNATDQSEKDKFHVFLFIK